MSEKMIWTPPTNLNAPIPPKGYEYRWARWEYIKKHIRNKKRKLFSIVRKVKLKSKKRYPYIHIKYLGKCVGVGGLVLIAMKGRIN